jgi:uncharacterized protein with PIN domain
MFVYYGKTKSEADSRETTARRLVLKYKIEKNKKQCVMCKGKMKTVIKDVKTKVPSKIIVNNGVRMKKALMAKQFAKMQYNGDVIISTHSGFLTRQSADALESEFGSHSPEEMAKLLEPLMKNKQKPKNIVFLSCNSGTRLSSPEKVEVEFDGNAHGMVFGEKKAKWAYKEDMDNYVVEVVEKGQAATKGVKWGWQIEGFQSTKKSDHPDLGKRGQMKPFDGKLLKKLAKSKKPFSIVFTNPLGDNGPAGQSYIDRLVDAMEKGWKGKIPNVYGAAGFIKRAMGRICVNRQYLYTKAGQTDPQGQVIHAFMTSIEEPWETMMRKLSTDATATTAKTPTSGFCKGVAGWTGR